MDDGKLPPNVVANISFKAYHVEARKKQFRDWIESYIRITISKSDMWESSTIPLDRYLVLLTLHIEIA